ncbi:MAG: NUDIX hydrolase [Lachnospiraceae bacterium]|nr:NUDIX hydrolase [Lachnospiraceae bacterium]
MKRTDRVLVKKNHIFDLYEDTLELPDGRLVKHDFLFHKGASAVVPVMEDGRLILVRQYRNAIDRFTLEIPAGGRNSLDEDFEVAAKRELEEETGYRSEDLEHLITLKTAVAFCNENIEVYIARNLEKTKQHLDDDEFIDIHIYTLEEILAKIRNFEIQDAKTIAAVTSYALTLK